jgi:hypothetical protein
MSKSINEEDWINKRISEGDFGFNVLTLDKLYNKNSLKGLKDYFKECCKSMNDASQTYINSRDGIPAFANWCKNSISSGELIDNSSQQRKWKLADFDYIYQQDGRVLYDFAYMKHAFKYLHNTILNEWEIKQLPGISDLALTIQSHGWFKNSERISFNKSEILEREINKISKDAVEYLYGKNLDDYEQITRHLNVIPPYGFMGSHTDDTSSDNRDFTVIVYLNTSREEWYNGLLKYHVPTFKNLYNTESSDTPLYSRFQIFEIVPLYTNIVIMNHTVNDNVAGLIRHEVDKNMSPDIRYSMYTTYREK